MSNRVEKVKVIGGGFAGQLHLKSIQDVLPDAEVLGRDIKLERLRKIADMGGHISLSEEEFLDEPSDLIITAVPPNVNLSILEKILKTDQSPQGIILEKPIGLSSNEVEKILTLTSEHNIRTMVGFTGHYHPEFVMAKALIEQGEIGDVITFDERIIQGGPTFPAHYVTDAYGGVVLENGIHGLDHVWNLLRAVQWDLTSADGGKPYWQSEANDFAEIKLNVLTELSEYPIIATLHWAFVRDWNADLNDQNYETIIRGTKGEIRVHGFNNVELIKNNEKTVVYQHDLRNSIRYRHLPGFRAELKAMVDAIENNLPSPIPVTYALKIHEMIDRIEEAIRAKLSPGKTPK